MTEPESLLSPKEVTALLPVEVSERSVQRWAERGLYGAQRIGGRWYFSRRAILAAFALSDPRMVSTH